MPKMLAIAYDGSKPLRNNKHELYARFRAQALPRIVAFLKAGNIAKNDHVADCHSFRLDKKRGVRQRIEFLSRQEGDMIAEKRRRLEEQLWAIHEADIGDCFETVEVAKSKDGKVQTDEAGKILTVKKQRAKLLADMPPELRKCIEDVTVDRNGNFVPRLYSRAAASKGLCALLNLGAQDCRPDSDVSKLSDAELIRQLADQAKELGVKIDLSYDFGLKSDLTVAASELVVQ